MTWLASFWFPLLKQDTAIAWLLDVLPSEAANVFAPTGALGEDLRGCRSVVGTLPTCDQTAAIKMTEMLGWTVDFDFVASRAWRRVGCLNLGGGGVATPPPPTNPHQPPGPGLVWHGLAGGGGAAAEQGGLPLHRPSGFTAVVPEIQ